MRKTNKQENADPQVKGRAAAPKGDARKKAQLDAHSNDRLNAEV